MGYSCFIVLDISGLYFREDNFQTFLFFIRQDFLKGRLTDMCRFKDTYEWFLFQKSKRVSFIIVSIDWFLCEYAGPFNVFHIEQSITIIELLFGIPESLKRDSFICYSLVFVVKTIPFFFFFFDMMSVLCVELNNNIGDKHFNSG